MDICHKVAAALKSGEAGKASCVVHHGWSDGAPKLRADQVAQTDHAESLSAQISGQLAAGASSRANIQRVDISEREITERQSSPKKMSSKKCYLINYLCQNVGPSRALLRFFHRPPA